VGAAQWIYGPRDRNTIPRVVARCRGPARIVGDGSNRSTSSRRRLAGTSPANHPGGAAGVYLSSEGAVSQRELIDARPTAWGCPATRTVPFRLAFAARSFRSWSALGAAPAPTLTRYAVALIGGRPLQYRAGPRNWAGRRASTPGRHPIV